MSGEYNKASEFDKIAAVAGSDVERQGWSHIKTNIDPLDSATVQALFKTLGKQFTQNGAIRPEITSLSPKEGSKVLATSTKAMSFHTDNAYLENPCKTILLFCAEQAEDGGENEVVDGIAAAKSLPDATKASLKEKKWRWTNPIKQEASPNFAILGSAEDSIRWWRMSLMNTDPASVIVADALEEALGTSGSKRSLLMQPGDLLLVDNVRTLHNRSAFVGSRQMHRARFW